MEVFEYLVGSPAFKAGGTGDPRTAGSIPVHLRQFSPPARIGVLLALGVVLVLLVPGVASGQARVLESTPQDGASLANIEFVSFEFDTFLLEAGAEIRVLRRDGTEIPIVSIEVDQSTLIARLEGQLQSGNYEVAYSVVSADGILNEGSIRVSVDSPEQALSGGLLAVVGIGVAMFGLMFFVFWRDQRRRPPRRV